MIFILNFEVHELCDNFCHRYISCLKGKMPLDFVIEEGEATPTFIGSSSSKLTSMHSSNSPTAKEQHCRSDDVSTHTSSFHLSRNLYFRCLESSNWQFLSVSIFSDLWTGALGPFKVTLGLDFVKVEYPSVGFTHLHQHLSIPIFFFLLYHHRLTSVTQTSH